jgi:hypothetical protein
LPASCYNIFIDVNYRAQKDGKANPLHPAFLGILFVTGNMGGRAVETTGKIRKIEITENTLFY